MFWNSKTLQTTEKGLRIQQLKEDFQKSKIEKKSQTTTSIT